MTIESAFDMEGIAGTAFLVAMFAMWLTLSGTSPAPSSNMRRIAADMLDGTQWLFSS